MAIRMVPLTPTQRVRQRIMRNNGIRVAGGIRPERALEVLYRRRLLEFINGLNDALRNRLFSQLRSQEMEYVRDNFIVDFTATIEELRETWSIPDPAAEALAGDIASRSNREVKRRTENAIGQALGIDVAQLIEGEGLTSAINGAIAQNVRLIKSIPNEFLDRVEQIVVTETVNGRSATSIIQQLQELAPLTRNRARVIARDQTNKMNSALTRARQSETGIRAYRWRTVGDEAVRETHIRRNGKVYAWNPADVGKTLADGTVLLDPNADNIGHPGEDIQCRCIPEPIIELDMLL